MSSPETPPAAQASRQGHATARASRRWSVPAFVSLGLGILSWTSSGFCHVVLCAIRPVCDVLDDVHEWAGLGPDGVGVVLVLIVVGLLALALLWLVLNGPVPMASVVIGIVAIRRIRRAGPRGRGLPLAIAGLVLGALSLASSAVSLLILAVLSRPQVWP